MEIPEGYDRLTALAKKAKDMYDREGLKRHNWDHISRNFDRARQILEEEPANIEITLAGVILHDIGYFHGNLQGHAHTGAEHCIALWRMILQAVSCRNPLKQKSSTMRICWTRLISPCFSAGVGLMWLKSSV
jgi:hypothetical protein